MVSTGIYLRVSTEEQAREGYSIRAQEEKLRSYATAKDWHIYNIYSDEGISGKDIDGRPAVKQLLSDIASGKVNNVLVYKIDRLTRSTKNLIELVELFNNYQCAFNSLIESIDTASATGRMFLKIVGIFAEFERENLAERVRLGYERKAKEGYSTGAYIPSFGYSREKGNKVQEVETEQAAIVRRIFTMYLHDDYSLNEIARRLNAENIATKKGRKWQNKTLKLLLTNPNYVGKVRYSLNDASRYFEADGQHEAIIDEDIFYRVQDKFSKLNRAAHTKRPTSGVYFCGVLYCPDCGGKYSTRWNYRISKDPSEGKIPVNPSYRCIDSVHGYCQAKALISHKKLARAFERYLEQIENFEDYNKSEIIANAVNEDNTQEIAAMSAEISQIERKTKEIMGFYMSGNVTFDEYQNMVKVGNERRGELEARLHLLKSVSKPLIEIYTKAEIITNFRDNWQTLNNEKRQQFIQKFIKKIVVHSVPDKTGRFRDVIIDEVLFNEY